MQKRHCDPVREPLPASQGLSSGSQTSAGIRITGKILNSFPGSGVGLENLHFGVSRARLLQPLLVWRPCVETRWAAAALVREHLGSVKRLRAELGCGY